MSPVRDPRGQHRAVGAALSGFGVFTLSLGGAMTALGVIDTGFLDGPTVVVIGLFMVGTGAWQWRSARSYEREPER